MDMSNIFIGCIYVSGDKVYLQTAMINSKPYANDAAVWVIEIDDGNVAAPVRVV
jgi:hypothetical protein